MREATAEEGSDDGTLVLRARAGDREAFVELMRRHEGWVLNLCLARLGSSEAAEEAAQETFVRAWRRLSDLAEPSAFRGWLRTVAERIAADMQRAASRLRGGGLLRLSALREDEGARQVARFDARAGERPGERPEEKIERDERRTAVARAIEGLDPAHREVVLLRYEAEHSCRRIARMLGITPAAVSMRLSRAHRELEKALAGWGDPA